MEQGKQDSQHALRVQPNKIHLKQLLQLRLYVQSLRRQRTSPPRRPITAKAETPGKLAAVVRRNVDPGKKVRLGKAHVCQTVGVALAVCCMRDCSAHSGG